MSIWPLNRVLQCVMNGTKVAFIYTKDKPRKLKTAVKALRNMPPALRAQRLILDRSNLLWFMDESMGLHRLPESDIRAIAVRAQVKRPTPKPTSPELQASA